ncbi:MAG: pyridoxal-phosphate dependent enzyme [Thermoleophilia bacterium]|nr:pyridoxal-phosphate dependent enzyme [Thermoleophilia bacterium]
MTSFPQEGESREVGRRPGSGAQLFAKLENLQPIGSFKIRGAYNAARSAAPGDAARGLLTASAGNMAQGVAWAARELGVPATIAVPDTAPRTKLDAIERLGGRVVKLPFDDWWRAIEEHGFDGAEGLFLHPVESDDVMAGNGTIGLEIVEDLPDVDTVVVPVGGGGLLIGIASALKQLRPHVRVVAVQPETAAPLAASLAAGEPREIDYRPTWIDGAGAKLVLPRMWPLLREVVDEAAVVTLDDVAHAIRILAERTHTIAEGAGALALAAALSGRAGDGKVVCVVSGGNIDAAVLARILAGETPH